MNGMVVNGNVTLTGSSSYTGLTYLSTGYLTLASSAGPTVPADLSHSGWILIGNDNNQFGPTTVVTVNTVGTPAGFNFGVIELDGHDQTVAGLSGGSGLWGFIENADTGTASRNAIFTINTVNSGDSFSYSGVIRNQSAQTLGLTKAGPGTQILTGSGISYTGPTTVTGGTLAMRGYTNGSNNGNVGLNQLSTSTINVSAGAVATLNMGNINFASANTGTTLSGAGTIRLTGGKWWLGNGGGVGAGTTIAMAAGGLLDIAGGTLSNDYANANRAERLEQQPEFGELLGTRGEPRAPASSSSTISGNSRRLARHAVRGERLLHPLVDQPLMRRVLVDEHDPGRRSRRGCRSRAIAPAPCRAAPPPVPARRCLRHPARRKSLALSARAATGSAAAAGTQSAARHAAASRRARAERGERGGGDRRRGAMPGGGERVAQGADDQAAHQRRVAEPHLGLGRMDVDVDLVRRAVEKQRDHRMAVAREHVLIGAAHRADQQFVAHRPAVDDEILVARQGAVEGRQADQPGQAESRRARRRSRPNSRRSRGRATPRAGPAREPSRSAAASRSSTRSSSPVTVKAMPG